MDQVAAHKQGRDVLLAFNKSALRKACVRNYDDEAINLSGKGSQHNNYSLNSKQHLQAHFQVKSVPQSLLALNFMAMILNGPNIESQGCDGVMQATATRD
jgi:hypothetical protein